MCMKKLLFILLLSPLSFAVEYKKQIDFNLECKVTGQVLIKSVDGVASTFSGYKDGYKIGDSFLINFMFKVDYFDNYNLTVGNTELIITEMLSSRNAKPLYKGGGLLNEDGRWKEDAIVLDGTFARTSLERYFKNDWHLMNNAKNNVGQIQRTLTANCMNMPDQWDEIISTIKEMDKEKWKGWTKASELD